MDDREIVDRIRAGEREAFRDLVKRYESPIFALLAGFVPGEHDREDIAQESFLAAFGCLDQFDPARGTFRAWLFGIARNRARNALKTRRPIPHPAAENAPAPEAGPDGFEELDRVLAKLPEELRTSFVLAEVHGFAYGEVAEMVGIPIGTVKSRIHRARRRILGALDRREERA